MSKDKFRTKRRWLLSLGVLAVVSSGGCQALRRNATGPGMMLVYGSVVDGRSAYVRSATLPDGRPFADPGSVGGRFRKGQTWKRGGVSATMAASGDRRGLPEWVEFVWQEPSYPGLRFQDFPTREDFDKAHDEKFAKLPLKTQRVYIKSRVPQEVVDEVIASKRAAKPGKVADKTLWVYIFWTPDGIQMRWAMMDQNASPGGFGAVVKEGGDDLDRYTP